MAITLSSIKVNNSMRPPRILLFGTAGIGKTTFAANAPNPIFQPVEDGLGILPVQHFPLAKSYDAVTEGVRELYTEEHDFGTYVLDSLDWLEPLIWQKVCQSNNKGSIEDFGYGKGYALALDYWSDFFEAMNALRDKDMCVILIAHCDIRKFEAPDTNSYDRYEVKLHKRASSLAQEWADIVLFANYETLIRHEDAGFNKKVAKASSTGTRLIYCQEKAGYLAKNRYMLPESLPLDWSAFSQALEASRQALAPASKSATHHTQPQSTQPKK